MSWVVWVVMVFLFVLSGAVGYLSARFVPVQSDDVIFKSSVFTNPAGKPAVPALQYETAPIYTGASLYPIAFLEAEKGKTLVNTAMRPGFNGMVYILLHLEENKGTAEAPEIVTYLSLRTRSTDRKSFAKWTPTFTMIQLPGDATTTSCNVDLIHTTLEFAVIVDSLLKVFRYDVVQASLVEKSSVNLSATGARVRSISPDHVYVQLASGSAQIRQVSDGAVTGSIADIVNGNVSGNWISGVNAAGQPKVVSLNTAGIPTLDAQRTTAFEEFVDMKDAVIGNNGEYMLVADDQSYALYQWSKNAWLGSNRVGGFHTRFQAHFYDIGADSTVSWSDDFRVYQTRCNGFGSNVTAMNGPTQTLGSTWVLRGATDWYAGKVNHLILAGAAGTKVDSAVGLYLQTIGETHL